MQSLGKTARSSPGGETLSSAPYRTRPWCGRVQPGACGCLVEFYEREARACYFELLARSGRNWQTRAGLKIQWYLVPCGFDPLP